MLLAANPVSRKLLANWRRSVIAVTYPNVGKLGNVHNVHTGPHYSRVGHAQLSLQRDAHCDVGACAISGQVLSTANVV